MARCAGRRHVRPVRRWLPPLAGVLLCAIAVLAAPARAHAQTSRGASPCRASARSALSDRLVALGDQVVVYTDLAWTCPERVQPFHLVVVVPVADAAAPGGDDLRADVASLAGRMALDANPDVRIGLVGYGDRAERLAFLTNDPAEIVAAVGTMAGSAPGGAAGVSGLASGIAEGLKVLALGATLAGGGESRDPLREALLVVAPSAPVPPASCGPVAALVEEARAAGVDLDSVCLGDCGSTCLGPALGDPWPRRAWDVVAMSLQMESWRSRLRAGRVDLHESLEPSLQLIDGSVDAEVGSYFTTGHRLHWRFDVRRRTEHRVRLSYAIRPGRAGVWPVRRMSSGVVLDTRGGVLSVQLPPLELVVAEGRVYRSYLPRLEQWLDGTDDGASPPKPLVR